MVESAGFFVCGGTVPPGAASYVERSADRELFDSLVAGEYCYVLNSRQMGKSSLAVRTVARLNAVSVRTAFVDLTRLGGATVTAEQWYAGLLAETGRALGLRAEANAFLRQAREVGAAQRFLSFVQDLALPAAETPLVLMVDEIDAVRSLGFSTDELFAGIRQLHNGRASDPSLKRLTICLLGAALPSDLIRDPRMTPFNVGRRIDLHDLTSEEALPFASALGGRRQLDRLLYWTGGHPFLTQNLGAQIAGGRTDVDALVRQQYLEGRARETDTNLSDVGRRLLGIGDPTVGEKERANTLSLYAKLLKGGIPDDESNAATARIKMSGVARLENGRLTIRNRIYGQVFDSGWIRENMPGQELRRQKKAFWKGVARALVGTSVVSTALTVLTVLAIRNAQRANHLEQGARYDAYVATMRTMPLYRQKSALSLMDSALKELKDQPWRGWEWKFWNHVANRAKRTIDFSDMGGWPMMSPDGHYLVETTPLRTAIVDLPTGRRLHTLSDGQSLNCIWLKDSRRFICRDTAGGLRLYDAATGKVLRRSRERNFGLIGITDQQVLVDGKSALMTLSEGSAARVDVETLEATKLPRLPGETVFGIKAAPQNNLAAWITVDWINRSYHLSLHEAKSGKLLRKIAIPGKPNRATFTVDGKTLAVGTTSGTVYLVDVATGEIDLSSSRFTTDLANIAFSPDGKQLIVAGTNREAILFDVAPEALIERQIFRDGGTAFFSQDGREVLVSYWDLRIYDAKGEPETPEIHLRPGIYVSELTARGELFAANGDFRVRLDLMDRTARATYSPSNAFVGEGARLVLGNTKSVLEVWELGSGRKVLKTPVANVTVFANASADGRYVAAPTKSDELSIFRIGEGQTQIRIPLKSELTAARFSPDGRLFCLATDRGTELFRTADGSPIPLTTRDRVTDRAIAFSPDGRYVAAGGDSDEACVWDTRSGRLVCVLRGHAQTVQSIAWSADASRIVTGSNDQTVRLWDPLSGKELGIIGEHLGFVNLVGFLPGGRTIASMDSNGIVKLWMTEARR